ncbi:MAG: hypothetical protein MZV63_61960 [Marinilabiliales bacterium]|nr:hypothetical protein [Marinilabiliales bacterium]
MVSVMALTDARIHLLHLRDNHVPDPVTGVFNLRVGAVFTVAYIFFCGKGCDLIPCGEKEWPDDAVMRAGSSR